MTQRQWLDFMSFYAGLPPLLVRVYPDEKTLKLAEALESFWKLLSDIRTKVQPFVPELVTTNGVAAESYF